MRGAYPRHAPHPAGASQFRLLATHSDANRARWPRDSEKMQTPGFMHAAPPARKPRMVAPVTHPDEALKLANPK
jgi:hypothetical protein